MKFSEAVSKRMNQLLLEQNKTQYRLIKETCLDKKTIQNLNRGKNRDLRMTTVLLIANFFGMTLSEFLDADLFNYENIDVD